MLALLHLLLALVFYRFKSRRRLEIENLYLRHQLNIAMRKAPQRFRLRGADRAFMVWMTRLWQHSKRDVLKIEPQLTNVRQYLSGAGLTHSLSIDFDCDIFKLKRTSEHSG